MKTIFRFIATLAVVLGFGTFAMAQNQQQSSDIRVGAWVSSELAVSQIDSLFFGTIAQTSGLTKTVAPDGTVTGSAGGAQYGVHAGVGKIVRSGDAQVDYKLSNVPTVLTKFNGTATMNIGSFATAYDFQNPGSTFNAGEGTVTDWTTVSGTGNDIYVFIGATITTTANTTALGEYGDKCTLVAEYN
ncbi:MAG TPA: DUF4402 domain-containing protein [Bacteroidales bacterium]|nr:DUF4402 domain-containing protein [Bacteroidales bacterium]HPS62116.1 DUF4402 domain-containing protein [Bacteroidales bacterium]